MSVERLTAAARQFLTTILPAATGRQLSALANADVLHGEYRRHAGAAVQAFGSSVTPQFMLRLSGAPAAIQDGAPNLAGAAVGDNAATQPLVWLQFRADHKTDNRAAIEDLMGDLDTYTQRKFMMGGVEIELEEDAPQPPNAAAWAAAVEQNRSQLPDDLSTLTETPAGFQQVAPTLQALKVILGHFFTYDENGRYYAKWAGAGRAIPQDLSPEYRTRNVRELQLEREQLYLYMLVPKALFTSTAAEAHDYREAVIRFDEAGPSEDSFLPTLVHSVYRRIETPHPFHDFVFFESVDGLGLAIPAGAQGAVSPAVEQFLATIPADPAQRAAFLEESRHVINGEPPLVQLRATLAEGAGALSLPQGATLRTTTGRVRSIFSPIEQVLEVAALDQVIYLDLDGNPEEPTLDLALPAVKFADLQAKLPAGQKNGEGVIVGVIDTGIDGSHPAFNDSAGNSRILAVWQQDEGVNGNPNSPAALNAGNAAYASFTYGREYTGAAVANASDRANNPGHGTHVAGIAAGADVTHANGNVPRGVASGAQIVAVRTIGVNQGNPFDALRYVFQKASEAGKPCVVNMSFGSDDHAHDGTDGLARGLVALIRDASNNYLPGRVLVAAAGNARADPVHVMRTVRGGAYTRIDYRLNPSPAPAPANQPRRDTIAMWVRKVNSTAAGRPRIGIAARHVATGWTSNIVWVNQPTISQPVGATGVSITISLGTQDVHNGDFEIRVEFSAGASPLPVDDRWRIYVIDYPDDVELHGWAVGKGGRFDGLTPADDSYKVGSPGTAGDVITVASSNSRINWQDIDSNNRSFPGSSNNGDVSAFSSPGPLRTCSNRLLSVFGMTVDVTHPALDITAPGCAIVSAMADNVNITNAAAPFHRRAQAINQNSYVLQGTSMASPVITGLVACLLAAEPTLTQDQARTRVRGAGVMPAAGATQFDAPPGAPDPEDWGAGLMDAGRLRP